MAPFTHIYKKEGDLIKHEEWNSIGQALEDLYKADLEIKGSKTFTGKLSLKDEFEINGNITSNNDLFIKGNVGIGTDNFDMILTVQGSLNVGGSGNGQLKVRQIEGKSHNSFYFDDLYLQSHSKKNTYINANGGQVGIGTIKPRKGASLDVQYGAIFKQIAIGCMPFGKPKLNPNLFPKKFSNLFDKEDLELISKKGLYEIIQMPPEDNLIICFGEKHSFTLSSDGTLIGSTKKFDIPDPRFQDENQRLVHACLEGPEIGVYYRGESRLSDGSVVIELPDYFEALTRADNRTVALSCKNSWSPLYVDGEIEQGRFTVKTTSQGRADQVFFWEVKAVRKDVAPLEVEM